MSKLGTVNVKTIFKTLDNLFYIEREIYAWYLKKYKTKNDGKTNAKTQEVFSFCTKFKKTKNIRCRNAWAINLFVLTTYSVSVLSVLIFKLLRKVTLGIVHLVKLGINAKKRRDYCKKAVEELTTYPTMIELKPLYLNPSQVEIVNDVDSLFVSNDTDTNKIISNIDFVIVS